MARLNDSPDRSFDARLAMATDILSKAGISRFYYAPPLHRLLWAIGVRVPPPYLASAAWNFYLSAAVFGPLFGLIMWFGQWRAQGWTVGRALLWSSVVAVLFATYKACYYSWSARRHKLPTWSELGR